jgi:hypothetical protein
MRIRRYFRFRVTQLIAILLICTFGELFAQEIEPRLYQSLPIGLNAAAVSYSYSHGNIVADVTSPVKDFVVTSHIVTPIYIRTFGLFGRLAKVQAMLPYVYMDGNLKLNGIDTGGIRSGLADARVRLVVNILGQPAIEAKDFQQYKEETALGVSVIVLAPTGQYFDDKIVNIGSNRWSIKSEIGFSQRYGQLYLETYAGVWFFTENNQFVNTNTLTQDPIFGFQAHLCYYFSQGFWVAVNSGYANGGETQVNGVDKHDFQNNVRMGATISVPLGRNHSLKFLAHTGVTTRIGGDFDMLTLAYQFTWF